jgi:hypothetical protein
MRRGLSIVVFLLPAAACARGGTVRLAAVGAQPGPPVTVAASAPTPVRDDASRSSPDAPCSHCINASMTDDERSAIERRIAELKQKGGHCSSYAAIIERSYRDGKIVLRPYMWRVGSQLASGEARPDGAMFLAREIDPLNRGRRPFDEVVRTIEHEAAHIAFELDSPLDRAPGDRADRYVQACRA